jgi:DNA-directed RNA polymerase specialized sigma24 family protein
MNHRTKTIHSWTDQRIVEGILAGGRLENEAIGALFERFRYILIRYIENKTQKTLSKQPEDILWEGIEAFVLNVKEGKYQPQADANLESYIKTICKNLWHNYLASETARETRQDVYAGFDSDIEPDISTWMIERENWEFYLNIFEKTGKNCKEIMHLTFAEDMSMKELAEKLIAEGKYENEQVVRNAKSKCLKKTIDLLQILPPNESF